MTGCFLRTNGFVRVNLSYRRSYIMLLAYMEGCDERTIYNVVTYLCESRRVSRSLAW